MSRIALRMQLATYIFTNFEKTTNVEQNVIMQRLIKWLGKRLSRQQSTPSSRDARAPLHVVPSSDQPQEASRQSNGHTANSADLVDLDTGVGGRIESVGPGKNVLIRNKYLREDSGTHETLKIIDDSIVETGEESGFDPYNTGQFDRSKSWKHRTRQ